MRNQVWYVALLIGLMCIIRFSFSALGYIAPHWFMEEIGLSLFANIQMPYAIRAWAIRDMVISILVVLADKTSVKMLLIGCLAIDLTDIISAYLSVRSGAFDITDGAFIKLTLAAIAALLPELMAIALLYRNKFEIKL